MRILYVHNDTCKQYRIGKRQASYGTLRDSIAETLTPLPRASR